MTSKLMMTIGAVIGFFFSVCWVLVSVTPMTWIISKGTVVSFSASLVHIHVQEGVVMGILTGVASLMSQRFSRTMKMFMDKDLWMDEARRDFCMVGLDSWLRWCPMWTRVQYSSWVMITLGVFAAGCFAVGSSFMLYYVRVHATRTGRLCCAVFYGSGAACAIAGISQYAALTHDFGHAQNTGPNPTSIYGGSFIVACFLAVVSWVPGYFVFVIGRRAKNEKGAGGGDDDEDWIVNSEGYGLYGPAYGVGYGTLDPAGAWGPATQGYGPAPGYGNTVDHNNAPGFGPAPGYGMAPGYVMDLNIGTAPIPGPQPTFVVHAQGPMDLPPAQSALTAQRQQPTWK